MILLLNHKLKIRHTFAVSRNQILQNISWTIQLIRSSIYMRLLEQYRILKKYTNRYQTYSCSPPKKTNLTEYFVDNTVNTHQYYMRVVRAILCFQKITQIDNSKPDTPQQQTQESNPTDHYLDNAAIHIQYYMRNSWIVRSILHLQKIA